MKRSIHMLNYASAILTVLAAMICLSSCGRDDVPAEGQGSGRFITFTAVEDSVRPDVTKGALSGVGDLLGDGFGVWASWTKDPFDKVVYGEQYYYDGVNGAVFGESGTMVTAADTDGDDKFVQAKDSWTYSPQQEWYRGYYSFAAVIPASIFSDGGVEGSHYSHSQTSAEIAYSNGVVTGVTYNNRLTLDFPDDLFVLGGHSVSGTKLPASAQPDLMYAFAEVDNTGNDAENVELEFNHTCSKLSIQLSVNDPDMTMGVQQITVYGLLSAIPTPLLEFTRTTTSGKSTETSNFSAMLEAAAESPKEYKSTLDDPFAVFVRPEGEGEEAAKWDVKGSGPDEPVAVRLVEDLIVFPEKLSASNQLKIKIDYKSGDDLLTAYVKVSQGEWLPGQSYVYSFEADYASDDR